MIRKTMSLYRVTAHDPANGQEVAFYMVVRPEGRHAARVNDMAMEICREWSKTMYIDRVIFVDSVSLDVSSLKLP